MWHVAVPGAGRPHMCSLYSVSMSPEHRLQIPLDKEHHRRFAEIAYERGASVATVVREAIDRGVSGPDARRRPSARRLLGAPDTPVPDPQALREELEALRASRAADRIR